MRMPHTPYHWILVSLVAAAFLLALSEAHGQSPGRTGAAALFEGRPAMAGAQAGQGAQAGPPQGGIGVQGADDLAKPLRKDIGKPRPSRDVTPPKDSLDAPRDAVAAPKDSMGRPRDSGLVTDQRSAAKKSSSAAKSTMRRSRTGVGEIGSRSGEGG